MGPAEEPQGERASSDTGSYVDCDREHHLGLRRGGRDDILGKQSVDSSCALERQTLVLLTLVSSTVRHVRLQYRCVLCLILIIRVSRVLTLTIPLPVSPVTHTWSLPPLHPSSPRPVARRAHSASFSPPHSIVVFGGGDGHAALNDTWVFNTVDRMWEEIISPVAPGEEGQTDKDGEPKRGPVPERRGYHSGHVVDGKLIIFGGGNGQKTFDAVEALDLSESSTILSACERCGILTRP